MAEKPKESVLRFKLTLPKGSAMDAFDRFFPLGQRVLNRTAWRGKEPRSCAVTKVDGVGDSFVGAAEYNVEVTYRPKGTAHFVGNTKYDGWTAMLLDQKKDGTLLDGKGQPLEPGKDPVYLPYELYKDAEFNDLDFGTFLGEFEAPGLTRLTEEEALSRVHQSRRVRGGIRSTFMAPRRQRPVIQILLTDRKLAPLSGDSMKESIMITLDEPHLKQVIRDRLYDLVAGFLEGRNSLHTITTDENEWVDLSRAIMELHTEENRTEFEVLGKYVTTEDLEEIAHHLMAVYDIEVDIVTGKRAGFLMRRGSGEAT